MKAKTRTRRWRGRLAQGAGGFRRWLIDRGSLTGRIQLRCPRFSVRRVWQGRGRAFQDERKAVNLRTGEWALVREVYLYCGETPVVFAHSVVAPRNLRGPWRMLAGLGSRPLGAALFADPRVTRTPLTFRKLNPRDTLFRSACRVLPARPRELWARRSVFSLRGRPILVTEVFLPALLELGP